MSSDPGIQTDSIDNIAGVQPLHFRVSIQLIKIGNKVPDRCWQKVLQLLLPYIP